MGKYSRANPNWTTEQRLLHRAVVVYDCLLWDGSKDSDGYGHFKMDGVVYYTHRVAWEIFAGPIPDGMCVCHTCDNPACININHLFLATHAENMADRKSKGREYHPPSTARPSAKLSLAQYEEIRSRYAAGEKQQSLAAAYGVHQTRISQIVAHK